MSYAHTQYSPNSFKDQKLMDKIILKKRRNKFKSKGRMIPSKSYGNGFRNYPNFPYKCPSRGKRNNRGMYTPLMAHYNDPRFSTFDNDFEDESEEEQIYDRNMMYEGQLYSQEDLDFEFENEQNALRMQEMMQALSEEKDILMMKYKEVNQKQNGAIQMLQQVTKERETIEKERLRIQFIKKEIQQQVRILKKKIEQANIMGLRHNNSTFLRNLEVENEEHLDHQDSEYMPDNTTTDPNYTELEEGSPLPSSSRQNYGRRPDMYYQKVSELYEENQNLQK